MRDCISGSNQLIIGAKGFQFIKPINKLHAYPEYKLITLIFLLKNKILNSIG